MYIMKRCDDLGQTHAACNKVINNDIDLSVSIENDW